MQIWNKEIFFLAKGTHIIWRKYLARSKVWNTRIAQLFHMFYVKLNILDFTGCLHAVIESPICSAHGLKSETDARTTELE